MRRALLDAGLAAREVDYVNAHATGTLLGDAAENRAIRSLMTGGEGQRKPQDVNVSSVKGAVGHLLGAAGAVEGVFTALVVRDNVLPPTVNLEQLGSGQEDDLREWDLNYVPISKQERTVDVALTNSFGFGGTCASLCFKKFKG
jgi:3-oxoacyl-[acyl-carrier-protein] synthase II